MYIGAQYETQRLQPCHSVVSRSSAYARWNSSVCYQNVDSDRAINVLPIVSVSKRGESRLAVESRQPHGMIVGRNASEWPGCTALSNTFILFGVGLHLQLQSVRTFFKWLRSSWWHVCSPSLLASVLLYSSTNWTKTYILVCSTWWVLLLLYAHVRTRCRRHVLVFELL